MKLIITKNILLFLILVLLNYKISATEEWDDLFCDRNVYCRDCESKILSIENVSKNCELPSFQNPKAYCCATWAAYACRDSAAKTTCTELEYQKYRQHWNRMAAHLYAGAPCGEYPFGSDKCKNSDVAQKISSFGFR